MSNRTLELFIIVIMALYVCGLFYPPATAAFGSFIHLLLVVLLLVVLLRLLQGWRPL